MYKWLNTHGKICLPCFTCTAYTWKKIFGHTLNVPSPNQGLEFEVNGFVCRDENATIISSFSVSLKFCSSTGIAAQFNGCGGKFIFCQAYIFFLIVSTDGKLTVAVPVISPSSAFKSNDLDRLSSPLCV